MIGANCLSSPRKICNGNIKNKKLAPEIVGIRTGTSSGQIGDPAPTKYLHIYHQFSLSDRQVEGLFL